MEGGMTGRVLLRMNGANIGSRIKQPDSDINRVQVRNELPKRQLGVFDRADDLPSIADRTA